MPKLPILTVDKVIKILMKHGFEFDHSRGSHRVYYNLANGKRVTVPYHKQDLPKGTLLSALDDQPIEKCKFLADRFLQIEGEVPHNIPTLTPFINTYLEYGMKCNDRASIQKARKYAQLGYDLSINSKDENDLDRTWYFDKYLGLSIFHGGSLGIKEVEKIEFHLGRYCKLDSSDQHANQVLMMASKMKHEIMKKDLPRSSGPTPTKKEEKKKGGFFSKLFG